MSLLGCEGERHGFSTLVLGKHSWTLWSPWTSSPGIPYFPSPGSQVKLPQQTEMAVSEILTLPLWVPAKPQWAPCVPGTTLSLRCVLWASLQSCNARMGKPSTQEVKDLAVWVIMWPQQCSQPRGTFGNIGGGTGWRQTPYLVGRDLLLFCCCSVAQSCPILCDPMDHSTAGFPVLHYPLELAQTHVHWVGDAIQPSHPLSSPSPWSFPASGSFPISQLFTSGGQSIGASASASVLPMNIQGWFPLGLMGLISLQSKGLLRIYSSTTVWKCQFFSAQPSLWSNCHICTWLLEKP